MKAILDIRNGQTYESEEAATKAGVPESSIAIRFTNGPFRDRVYRRNGRGQLELVASTKDQLHRGKTVAR
jgi:hypothetical protein